MHEDEKNNEQFYRILHSDAEGRKSGQILANATTAGEEQKNQQGQKPKGQQKHDNMEEEAKNSAQRRLNVIASKLKDGNIPESDKRALIAEGLSLISSFSGLICTNQDLI